jgi:hypothetical protein
MLKVGDVVEDTAGETLTGPHKGKAVIHTMDGDTITTTRNKLTYGENGWLTVLDHPSMGDRLRIGWFNLLKVQEYSR